MDLLSQHEAFLRAIFDAPDDDTPRLVYADFLQEQGDEDRAEFIRVQCEHNRLLSCEPGTAEHGKLWDVIRLQVTIQRRLAVTHPQMFSAYGSYNRGFGTDYSPQPVVVSLEDLSHPITLRERLVFREPYRFAVQSVAIGRGRIVDSAHFDAFFNLAAFARVIELDLQGAQESVSGSNADGEPVGEDAFATYLLKPKITTPGVEALSRHRGVRRITALDLRNNDLDNDAARALVKSPYLDNLKRLRLLEGNRLRGRVWQQVIERFGEDVVG